MTALDENDGDEISALLMGRKVTKVSDDTLRLDDGTLLKFVGNADCCAYYDIEQLNGVDNIITRVELLNDPDDEADYAAEGRKGAGVYEIFVYAGEERINLVRFEGTDSNGYYGTGYTIWVTKPDV